MKILLTGANGFIGRHLLRRLQTEDIEILALVRPQSDNSYLEGLGIELIPYSEELKDLEPLIQHRPSGIVHLASLFISNHQPDDVDPLIDSNIRLGAHLLEASAQAGVQWFLSAGTHWQNFQGEPYNPVNLYAATKQAFDDLARYYAESGLLRYATLKLGDTYGPEDTRRKIYTLWTEIAESGAALDMSPGHQFIDIVHVDDVTLAFRTLIQKLSENDPELEPFDSFYLTSGEEITLKELAARFEAENKVKLNINWGGRPYRPREVMKPGHHGKQLHLPEESRSK